MRILKALLVIVGGLACGAGIVLAYQLATGHANLNIPGVGNPGAVNTAPGPVFNDAGSIELPDRLIIPKIGVDAHVKHVGVDAKGDMATPGNAVDTAWYKHGPRPGQPGSAVIDGHLNTKEVPRAVFYRLDELEAGDEVRLRTQNGQELVFKVTEVKRYAEDASAQDVFISNDGKPHLNLITCTGDWVPEKRIYTERLVVFTERVQ